MILILESFDMLSDVTALGRKGWAVSSGAIVSGGRQENCFFISGTYMSRQVPSAQQHATFTLGAAVMSPHWYGNSSESQFFGLAADGNTTLHVRLSVSAGNLIEAFVGNTLIGSGGFLPHNTWMFIELKVVLDSTAGSIQVNLNDSTVISATGINTRNGGSASTFDSIRLGNSGGGGEPSIYFDDVYLTNGAGSINTGMLGDLAVVALRPNNNGDFSQLTNDNGNHTNNYTYVNSHTTQTTTFVQSPTPGDEDTYRLDTLSYPAATILGVQTVAYADKNNNGARTLTPVIRESTTDYTGSAEALSTAPTYLTEIFELDPGTSAPWTVTNINGYQFGVRVG